MCSSTVFMPSIISIAPPTNSAFDLCFVPNRDPIFRPVAENRNVVIPIQSTENHIFRLNADIDIPTASASILVATANRNMVFTSRELFTSSSSFDRDSRIMFIPIAASNPAATQWSNELILSIN